MSRAFALLLTACHTVAPAKPNSIQICDRTWEPGACLDAGHYFLRAEHNVARAVVMYDRGCKRNSLDACIAGSKYSLELASAACDKGYEPACADAARYQDGDLPRSRALLERQCNQEPPRCAEGAWILVERDEPSALALVRHACELPDQREACIASLKVRFEDEANVLEVARLGCATDVALSCLQVGSLSTSPDEKREMFTRACKLKLADGCAALGKLISKP